MPEHRSFVLYHNNSPRWSEVIKLPIPIDRFRGSHLRFEFRHCSSECVTCVNTGAVMANGMIRVEKINEDPRTGTRGGAKEAYCKNKTQNRVIR